MTFDEHPEEDRDRAEVDDEVKKILMNIAPANVGYHTAARRNMPEEYRIKCALIAVSHQYARLKEIVDGMYKVQT